MEIKQYQKETQKFATYPSVYVGKETEASWTYPVTALGEEAGEVQGKFAKALRDDNGVITEARAEEIKKELGDVMWMISQICNECGFDLAEILDKNIAKLTDRKNRNVINGSGDNR